MGLRTFWVDQFVFSLQAYVANGKDGYVCLTDADVLVDEECGPILSSCVQNHFKAISMKKGLTRKKSVHRQSLVTLSRR